MAARREDLTEPLFAAPLGAFSKARAALVRQLQAAGRASDAAAVKQVPKPSRVVWIANQVARQAPKSVAQFLEAFDRLRRAQLRDPAAMRTATAAERDALTEILDRARSTERLSPALARRLSETFLGAAADADGRRALSRGRLQREYPAPGFGLFAGARPPARPRTRGEQHAEPPTVRATGRPSKADAQAPARRAAREIATWRAKGRDRERAAARHQRARQAAERTTATLRERLTAAEQRAKTERQAEALARKEAAQAHEAAERASRVTPKQAHPPAPPIG